MAQQDEVNEHFQRQLIMSAQSDLDMKRFDYARVIERFYPPKTVVKVTKGRGSWVGVVYSIKENSQAGYLNIKHIKSGKHHTVYWTDMKFNH